MTENFAEWLMWSYDLAKQHGVCRRCKERRPEYPMLICVPCLQPAPRTKKVPKEALPLVAPLLPGLKSNTPEYRRAYHALQQGKKPPAAIQYGCCGTLHNVTTLPMRLPCGHVVALPEATS